MRPKQWIKRAGIIEAHLNILPIHLTLQRYTIRTYTRLATIASARHISTESCEAKSLPKQHHSSLHKLANESDIRVNPQEVETITTTHVDPNQRTLEWINIGIANNRKDAIKENIENNNENELCIYSDGSGLGGWIGAAAVVHQGGRVIETWRYRLGSAEKYTVYEGELVGLLLAAHALGTRNGRIRSATVVADDQEAIKAVLKKGGPGEYIAQMIKETLHRARESKTLKLDSLTLRWAPGHEGIVGNELADKAAKQASKNKKMTPSEKLPQLLRKKLPVSISATCRDNATRLKRPAVAQQKTTSG